MSDRTLGERTLEATKWYRLVDAEGVLKAETSDPSELKQFFKEGDRIQRLWTERPRQVWLDERIER